MKTNAYRHIEVKEGKPIPNKNTGVSKKNENH